MNEYELALQNIKDAIDMLHRHIFDGTFNHPYWSISKIQELINKDKKYAWHDLRKNHEDLPIDQLTHVIVWDKDFKCCMFARYDGHEWLMRGDGNTYFPNVIAWREIEPFEGTE